MSQFNDTTEMLVNLESMVSAALEIRGSYLLTPAELLLMEGVVHAGRSIAHRLVPGGSNNHSDKPEILYPESVPNI